MEHKYEILKDLPGINIGEFIVYNESIHLYMPENGRKYYFDQNLIDNNPDFFREVKSKALKK